MDNPEKSPSASPPPPVPQERRNIARFCVDNPHISWALLVAVFVWGWYAYQQMPKSKDPNIPVRIAVAITPWPGQDARLVEELVTRPIEQKIAESEFVQSPNARTFGIQSLTLSSVSMVQIQLAPGTDRDKAFNELNLKLNALNASLPEGAGPIQLNTEFGDTAAVLLSVASPKADATEITLRAEEIAQVIRRTRAGRAQQSQSSRARASMVVALPLAVNPGAVGSGFRQFRDWLRSEGLGRDLVLMEGPGYVGVDFIPARSDQETLASTARFLRERLGTQRFFPDAWQPVIIHDPATTEDRLKTVAGDKYSYQQLDDFSDLLAANIATISEVKRVLRSGVLPQQVNLTYSQEQLAAYGVRPDSLAQILHARNTTIPGGVLAVEDMNVTLSPSGDFTEADQIGDVIVARSRDDAPVYLRSIVDIRSGYQLPPRLLNFYTWRDQAGNWQRSRSINLAVQMHVGEQIGDLGKALEKTLAQVRVDLPDDLIVERVSDQPRQVKESISLFMEALIEAVVLVVIVALIGFWEWRSALLLMISIPITLAMTFGFISVLGIEIQQVSIAALIIALGLLVDDPVVAGDAIKRQMAAGQPRATAAWLGPTLLAKAIFFATLTNVVAYLPFLMLSGNQGDFLHSLPIVMACALIASRIVSMTFLPFLGNLMLRPPRTPPKTLEDRRRSGFTGHYCRLAGWAIDHRKKVLLGATLLLVAGFAVKTQLKNAFFPDDVQYLSYVDVWLKNDANIEATDSVTQRAEQIIRETLDNYQQQQQQKKHHHKKQDSKKNQEPILQSLSTTLGGGAPRFWFTINPEQHQANYGQIIVRLSDKELTPKLVPYLQRALSAKIPGAHLDVRQLQTTPVKYPFAIRLSGRITSGSLSEGEDIALLRQYASQVENIVAQSAYTRTVRQDWGGESLVVNMDIQEDRANLSGVTNADIALASSTGINGTRVGTLRQGDKQIPIVARLRLDQRAQLSDLNNLYVYASKDNIRVPLLQVASTAIDLKTERIRRLEQFRTITVFAYPHAGQLSSEIMGDVHKQLRALADTMPLGYQLEMSGDAANTKHGFKQLLVIMGISAASIFMALVFQFSNLIKPLVVFATVPFGMIGALTALYFTGQPFGFMAFLGIVSLIGVIVSHIIVLFDFIENRHAAGDPFRQALLDAGVMRLRPILITIAATTLALVPLAFHGGPLWQPLCFAQIGGLILATFGTLILVPVIYATAVLDLGWIHWQNKSDSEASTEADPDTPPSMGAN